MICHLQIIQNHTVLWCLLQSWMFKWLTPHATWLLTVSRTWLCSLNWLPEIRHHIVIHTLIRHNKEWTLIGSLIRLTDWLIVGRRYFICNVFISMTRRTATQACYSAQAKTGAESWIQHGFFFFLVGVAIRHSWGADWSQVSNLETLIGLRALYLDHVL